MLPATGHSHDAIEALQTTLLARHLAAKAQCLLHALPWRGGMSSQISRAFWAGAGPGPGPAAGVLTLGQAEDDGCVEGVSGPQSVHHLGRWESVGVEQPSIRAQGIGTLLSPGTDQRSPVTPSTQLGVSPALAPSLIIPPRGRPWRPGSLTPRTRAAAWLPLAHPFLTRPYRPLRASFADWNPKCLATSLLTNTCGQWKRG